MTQLGPLLAAVTAAPDDPAPRHAYAAAVRATDPDRAKLIELQLELRDARRRGEDPGPERTQPVYDLVKKHGRAWAGKLNDHVSYVGFHGGFPEEIEIDAPKLITAASTIGKLAPIRHLRVRKLKGRIADVAALPLLRQLVSLDVASNQLSDVDVAELLTSPGLAGIQLLRLTDNPITMDAHRAIARSNLPVLRFVEASQTEAPLVIREEDWDGSAPHVSYTRAQGTLVRELGNLPWLTALEQPSTEAL